jgi:FkbM family methyltransferase
MRKIKRFLLFFRYCHPWYYPNGILVFAALCIYEIASRTRWCRPLVVVMSRQSIVLCLAGQRFSIPFFPGDLGVIFDCFIGEMYGTDPRFVPAQGFVCLDIGANIGAVSARWRATNSKGTIIAVEPHPHTFARLVQNKRLNNWDNVECVNAAISSCSGKLPIDLSQALTMAIIGNTTCGSEEVASLSLDNLVQSRGINTIHLCKIDVEGHEDEVLRGAVWSLPRIERLILEFHSRKLRDAVVSRLGDNFEIVRETQGNIGLIFAVNKGSGLHRS